MSRAMLFGVLGIVAPCSALEPPGKIIDLSSWKLTLPIATQKPGRPDEILGPHLAEFVAAGIFEPTQDGNGVVFRAACGGVTTSGSGYPRCELREMQPGGKKEVAWSTDDSTIHSLAVRLAVTHLPAVKPHVVCAQIHDAEDDLIEVRLEGKKLQLDRRGESTVMFDRDYLLGTLLDLKIDAGAGHVRVFCNGEQKNGLGRGSPRLLFQNGLLYAIEYEERRHG